jgi:hypothetical protein
MMSLVVKAAVWKSLPCTFSRGMSWTEVGHRGRVPAGVVRCFYHPSFSLRLLMSVLYQYIHYNDIKTSVIGPSENQNCYQMGQRRCGGIG